jgi:hypothetical protein
VVPRNVGGAIGDRWAEERRLHPETVGLDKGPTTSPHLTKPPIVSTIADLQNTVLRLSGVPQINTLLIWKYLSRAWAGVAVGVNV